MTEARKKKQSLLAKLNHIIQQEGEEEVQKAAEPSLKEDSSPPPSMEEQCRKLEAELQQPLQDAVQSITQDAQELFSALEAEESAPLTSSGKVDPGLMDDDTVVVAGDNTPVEVLEREVAQSIDAVVEEATKGTGVFQRKDDEEGEGLTEGRGGLASDATFDLDLDELLGEEEAATTPTQQKDLSARETFPELPAITDSGAYVESESHRGRDTTQFIARRASRSEVKRAILEEFYGQNEEEEALSPWEVWRRDRELWQKERKKLAEENERLRMELMEWKKKLDQLIQHRDLAEEVHCLVEELSEHKQVVKKLQIQVAQMAREKDRIEEEKAYLQKQLRRLSEVAETLQEEKGLERFLEYVESTRQKLKQDSRAAHEKMEVGLAKVRDRYLQLEKLVAYIRELKDLIQEDLKELEREVEKEKKQRESFETRLGEFEEFVRIAQNHKVFFRERCRELEKQIEILQGKKEALAKKAEDQEEKILQELAQIRENTLLLNTFLKKLLRRSQGGDEL